MSQPITEEWLRETGFKWEQLERQPSKHWILWLAAACIDPVERRAFASNDDLGIELAAGDQCEAWWYCWLRADYAGRYSRFLHVRHVTEISEVVAIIEALTGRKWDAADCMYGSFHPPEIAARFREENKRLDRAIAADWGDRNDDDPSQRGVYRPK
jgi:hypothetical protein